MDLGGLKTRTTRALHKPITVKSLKTGSKNRKILVIVLIVLAVVLVALASYFTFYKKTAVKPVSQKSLETGNQSYESALTDKNLTSDERVAAYKKSISDLEQTIKSDPNNVNTLLKVASAYYNIGAIDKAITTLQNAISIDSNNALLHNNLGNFLREKGDIISSDAEYRKAIGIDPKLASAYINLAINLHDKEGKTQEAIGILQQGLAYVPEDLGMKTLLGEYQK